MSFLIIQHTALLTVERLLPPKAIHSLIARQVDNVARVGREQSLLHEFGFRVKSKTIYRLGILDIESYSSRQES